MSIPKEKEASYADKENEGTVFLTRTAEQKPLLRWRAHRNAENTDGREMAGGARLPYWGRHPGWLTKKAPSTSLLRLRHNPNPLWSAIFCLLFIQNLSKIFNLPLNHFLLYD